MNIYINTLRFLFLYIVNIIKIPFVLLYILSYLMCLKIETNLARADFNSNQVGFPGRTVHLLQLSTSAIFPFNIEVTI